MRTRAYLLEVTAPNGQLRRELYHTFDGADQAAKMYARSSDGWKTDIKELIAADLAVDGGAEHG